MDDANEPWWVRGNAEEFQLSGVHHPNSDHLGSHLGKDQDHYLRLASVDNMGSQKR